MAPNPTSDISMLPVMVLDNGGYSMKIGSATDPKARVIPNWISKTKHERRRPFIGSQLDDCRDTSGLFFMLPFQKGYMCNPDLEKTIWDFTFGPDCLNINPAEHNIVITEPHFNFSHVQEAMCELLFEEYEFQGVCRTTSAHLIDYKHAIDNANCVCSLVVDTGYSFTHIIPFVNGKRVDSCVRRINIGGKALTNHLKEIVSYRQLHVMDETFLINQVKEDVCYVAQDFMEEMKLTRKKLPENKIIREYVLPDYTNIKRGFIRSEADTGKRAIENEQILRMNNERFSVPELLFHPSDVGINQQGIPECIHNVIASFPFEMQSHFYRNIVLVGGSAKFPGIKDRLTTEIRSRAPTIFDVNVTLPVDPVTAAWEGGCLLAKSEDFSKYLITKSMYNELGLHAFAQTTEI